MPDGADSLQPDDLFPQTTITLVHRLHSQDEEQRRTALAQVAQRYWFPLYRYARTHGLDAHAASDAVQDFFRHLIRHEEALGQYDAALGCLRGWIITIFRNQLANRKEHAHRLRRGGGVEHVPFDLREAEHYLRLEPADSGTPEEIFDRGFARQLWRHVLETVRGTYIKRRREHVFEVLHPLILSELRSCAKTTIELANELGLSGPNELKVVLHRLRAEAAREFKRAVRDTVPGDGWHDEVRYLLKLIA